MNVSRLQWRTQTGAFDVDSADINGNGETYMCYIWAMGSNDGTTDAAIYGENKDQTINDILMRSYPWQEADTNRLDKINVVKFWRLLTGHKKMDVDYWLTRIENELY